MKQFNSFKDNLRNEASDMPEGFGWEDMQESIFDKMEDKNDASQGSKRIILLLISGLICLCAIVISISLFNKNQNPQNKNTNTIIAGDDNLKTIAPNKLITKTNEEDLNIESKQTSIVTNQTQAISNPSKISHNNLKSELIKGEIKTKNDSKSQITTNNFETAEIESKRNTQEANKNILNTFENLATKVNKDIAAQASDHQKTNTPNLKYNYSNAIPSFNQKNLDNDLAQSSKDENTFAPSIKDSKTISKILGEVHTLPIIKSSIVAHSKNIDIDNPTINNPIEITPLEINLWRFEIGGGRNTWSYGFKNTQSEDLIHSNTKSDIGYSFSARITRDINTKLSLTSGLEYDMLYKKAYAITRRYEERNVDDLLIGHATNPLTGETAPVIVDTVLVDTFLKVHSNYNKLRMISLPVNLNYEILNRGHWNMAIGIGTILSYLTQYSGSYLDDNTLVTYDESTDIYDTGLKLAINANLSINRSIASDYYVGLRLDYKNHLNNWALQNGTVVKPKIFTGSLTVGRVF